MIDRCALVYDTAQGTKTTTTTTAVATVTAASATTNK